LRHVHITAGAASVKDGLAADRAKGMTLEDKGESIYVGRERRITDPGLRGGAHQLKTPSLTHIVDVWLGTRLAVCCPGRPSLDRRTPLEGRRQRAGRAGVQEAFGVALVLGPRLKTMPNPVN